MPEDVAELIFQIALRAPRQHARSSGWETILTDNGGISPTKLPRHQQVPVAATLSASVATVDGSHLPAAREVVIDIGKNIHVNAKGLPICKGGQLEARDTKAARRILPCTPKS